MSKRPGALSKINRNEMKLPHVFDSICVRRFFSFLLSNLVVIEKALWLNIAHVCLSVHINGNSNLFPSAYHLTRSIAQPIVIKPVTALYCFYGMETVTWWLFKFVRLINQTYQNIYRWYQVEQIQQWGIILGSCCLWNFPACFHLVMSPASWKFLPAQYRFRDPDTREKRDKSASTFYGSNLPWCPNERYFSRGGRRVLPLAAAQSVQRHLRGAPNRRRWESADRLRAHWKRNRRFLR